MTAFSDALYYPTMNINNSTWLKTAVLFWDSIFTIVPERYLDPYQSRDAKFLFHEGFLKPLAVNSYDKTVMDIDDEFIKLLHSPMMNKEYYKKNYDKKLIGIHAEKMSMRLRREVERWQKKTASMDANDYCELLNNLRHEFEYGHFKGIDHEFYYIDPIFTNLYMTVLAEKLSEKYALAMVTDTIFSFDTGNRLRLNNEVAPILFRDDVNKKYMPPELKESILLDYVINGFSIRPECSLEDIMEFKKKHRDELGLFKNELQRLTEGIDTNKTFDAISGEINDIYNNSFLPAFDNLKKALKYSRIRWVTETFLKVSLITTSTTGIPMALMGMPVDKALFAGAGLSVIASLVSYDINRRETLLNNPYSYLLSIQNEL